MTLRTTTALLACAAALSLAACGRDEPQAGEAAAEAALEASNAADEAAAAAATAEQAADTAAATAEKAGVVAPTEGSPPYDTTPPDSKLVPADDTKG